MIKQTTYHLDTIDGTVSITITPINELLPSGDYYKTGVYKLTNGVVGMGEIIFDETMTDWEYNGMDELTWEEAAEVAGYIKNYKDPAAADPDLLQSPE
ncbi:MAG: hypothetical protein ABJA76_12845 [Mucilaginibacter sp.]